MTRSTAAGRLAALAGVLALAGTSSTARAALSYDLSLGAGVIHTDNLHLDPEPGEEGRRAPVRETIITGIPGVVLVWDEGRDRLAARYRGEYWTFSGDEDLDPLWLHDLKAELGWRRWRPFFLESEAVRERAPRFRDREGESILEQLDRSRLAVRSGFAWEQGAVGTVELAYRGALEWFSGGDGAEDDRIQRHFGEALVRRRWSPLWQGELSASYGRVARELSEDSLELRVATAIDRRLSERLTARAGLEWLRADVDVGTGEAAAADDTGGVRDILLKSAEVKGALERGGFWSLRYADRREAQPDGDTLETGRVTADALVKARLGSEITVGAWYETAALDRADRDGTAWGPLLRARWRIAPWAAADLGGSWVQARLREAGEAEIEDHTIRAGGALVLLLGRRVTFEGGGFHRQTDSNAAGRSHAANLFYAALTAHFGQLPPGWLPASAIVRWTAPAAGWSAER